MYQDPNLTYYASPSTPANLAQENVDGLFASSPDSEVWNISYDTAKSSWNITNTVITNNNRICYIGSNSILPYFIGNTNPALSSQDRSGMVDSNFPFTNTNVEILKDGNGYYQLYITMANGDKKYLFAQQTAGSNAHALNYGLITLIAENNITTAIKDSTLFKIANNVYNPYFFAPGTTPQGTAGYIDVRIQFLAKAPARFLVISSSDELVSAHKDSIWMTSTSDTRYQNTDWRITYQGSGLGYDIVNINQGHSMAEFYQNDGTFSSNPLTSIADRYFDIETVTVAGEDYYRTKSRENPIGPYATYSNLWTGQADPGSEDSDGSLDPVYFEVILASTNDPIRQHVQFASITAPYDIYSTGRGIP